MKLGEKIRKNTLWLFAGGVLSRGIVFIAGIILARILVPEDFGLVVTIQIFTGIVAVVAGGGMGQALIRADDVTAKHFNVIFTIQLVIGIVIYLCFWRGAPYIANFFDNSIYEQLILVSALTFIIRPFNNISNAKLSRNYNFKVISLIAFLNVIISSVISIVMALEGYGVWSLVFSGLITSVLIIPVNLWLARWVPRLSYDYNILKNLGAYGFKVSVSHILYSIMVQIPNSFISKVQGPEALGLFNKATSLSEIPLQIIAGPVTQTVFRGMAEYKNDANMSKYLYFKTLTLLCVYLFPFFTSMFWLAEPFVVIVYGENWRLAGQVMSVVALWGFFRTMMRPATVMNDSHDKLKEEIKLDIEFIILSVTLLLFLAQYGIKVISWYLVVMGIYQLIRVTRLAYSCMQTASLKDFFNAIAPAFILNSVLATFLFIINYFIEFSKLNSVIELLMILGVIVFGYFMLFMFFPIKLIVNEQNKIKSKFSTLMMKTNT